MTCKPRPAPPQPGDRVRLRGRDPRGTLVSVTERGWCRINWDGDGPTLCHLNEIEKVTT